jgi:ribosomal protein L22
MDEVLKHVYENIGEVGSLSSPTTLSKVASDIDGSTLKKAKEYLENEPSYTLHRNRRLRGKQYRQTKAFFPLHIMLTDF